MNGINTTQLCCPVCQKTVLWDRAFPYRPFCSQRCRTLDLGAWASDKYFIACKQDDEAFTFNEDTTLSS